MTEAPRYVNLHYMAALLELPWETLKQDHKRANRRRRERCPLPADMPAPDAPADVQDPYRPKWLKETADAYVLARVERMRKHSTRALPAWVASGQIPEIALPGQKEDGDSGKSQPEGDERTAYPTGMGTGPAHGETRDRAETDSGTGGPSVGGPPVDHEDQQPAAAVDRPRPTAGRVMIQLSKPEKELADFAIRQVLGNNQTVLDALNGPRGWSAAIDPATADQVADALMQTWRAGRPTFELATRFVEERHPARRTKRGGWAAGVRAGDQTE